MSPAQRILLFLTLVLIVFSSFTNLYALEVERQFRINLTVTAGADVTPPTTPTALTATAVSSSQINLSWTASTDNVGVVGYKIYRDGVFVATSIGTAYSDIGLEPSTTYSYTVTAIDAAGNESGHSNVATATTFATVVVIIPGQHNIPQIYNLKVVPTLNGATITYNTSEPTIGTLTWGLTQNYELGAVSETIFDTAHTVTLIGLTSGTVYYFKIDVVSGYGMTNSLLNQSFKTLSLPEGIPNPTNFVATPQTSTILLTWNNPTVPNFSEVRLVRSTNFFPADPSDGEVIYEGSGQQFSDTDVVVGTRYYYTLFAKDNVGNYSSGVLAQARIPFPGEVVTPPIDIFGNLPPAPAVNPIINALTFLDFDFIQDGKLVAKFSQGSSVTIDGTKNLTISLDYAKVPDVLKSVVVTLHYPTDATRTFSFLLRINPEKTAFTATIGPLGESGTYGVTISIVDFKNRGLKKINGELIANVFTAFQNSQNGFSALFAIISDNFWNLLLLLILLILLYLLYRHWKKVRDKKRKEQEQAKQTQQQTQI